MPEQPSILVNLAVIDNPFAKADTEKYLFKQAWCLTPELLPRFQQWLAHMQASKPKAFTLEVVPNSSADSLD